MSIIKRKEKAMHSNIELTVNGKAVIAKDGDKSLLRFLREDLGLVGAKNGCERNQCGSCVVSINNTAASSCVYPVWKLEGAEIETIEGLAKGGDCLLYTSRCV